ncbi:hypothetical protein M9H77_16837 [Catharanthus roseus]|uniref:Uncharacterized protein n=1 Tax=Catharanthus roseus TaxID=4058 RepID=A0ACC0B2W8_CATRO|nr:hypothetical protein M9H77_16837 [Catharanthus roseus]
MAWEAKAKDRLRDLLGSARGKNKRPPWIDERYWSRCGIIGIPLRIKPSTNGIRGTTLNEREDREPENTRDLTEKFSRSKYFEELDKHQKGEYVHFRLAWFWEKFHEVQRMAKEDAEASSTA